MLADALVGLGLSPLLASRMATGGVGPLTITAKGTSYATGQLIGTSQFLVSCNSGAASTVLSLPTVGGDNGALLADDYIINNANSQTIQIFASSGVSLSIGATNTSSTSLAVHTTITLFPISTTQWIGVKGS